MLLLKLLTFSCAVLHFDPVVAQERHLKIMSVGTKGIMHTPLLHPEADMSMLGGKRGGGKKGGRHPDIILPSQSPSISVAPSPTPSTSPSISKSPSESLQPSKPPSSSPSTSQQPSNVMCQIRLIVGCIDDEYTGPGVIECGSIPAVAGSTPEECMREVRFSYRIFNDGTEPFNLVVADRMRTTVDPVSGSFLGNFPSMPVTVFNEVAFAETVVIDRCTQFTSATTVMVEAEPQNGPDCSAQGSYVLTFN